MAWTVYILSCSDKSLYTGITVDVERRLNEHNNSNKGARYTRARRPVKLIYQESCVNRSEASQRELQIKKLTRSQKLAMINS